MESRWLLVDIMNVDFSKPESVIFYVSKTFRETTFGKSSWKNWIIEEIYQLESTKDEDVEGSVAVEMQEGGFMDYAIMEHVSCPQRVGWFVVENITGKPCKSSYESICDDDFRWDILDAFRPATSEEIAAVDDCSKEP